MEEKVRVKKQIEEAKHLMYIHKPSIGYLGSQYYYWEERKKKLEKKLEQIKENLNEY